MIKLCIKCGVAGHTNKTCKGPVTSFGLVVLAQGNSDFVKGRMYPFKQVSCDVHDKIKVPENKKCVSDEMLILLVERKDTVGFLNIVQGSYPDLEPFRSKKLAKYVYELTCEERKKLLEWDFKDLWKLAGSNKKDYLKAQSKFEKLDIKDILDANSCTHQEADFLMPKGRLKFGETIRQCALREFSEETGYNKNDVELLDIQPFEEQFIGTDGKTYKNVFFVAKMKSGKIVTVKLGDDPNQSKEVRNVGWFNLNECNDIIRTYHQDKKDILNKVFFIIEKNPKLFTYVTEDFDNNKVQDVVKNKNSSSNLEISTNNTQNLQSSNMYNQFRNFQHQYPKYQYLNKNQQYRPQYQQFHHQSQNQQYQQHYQSQYQHPQQRYQSQKNWQNENCLNFRPQSWNGNWSPNADGFVGNGTSVNNPRISD